MEWISVKDRLPRIDEYCLAFGKRDFEWDLDGTEDEEPNSVWNAFYIHSGFLSLVADETLNGCPLKCLFWMPLPSSPKD